MFWVIFIAIADILGVMGVQNLNIGNIFQQM